MKFLCLPGAYGSAENFAVQLGPLTRELENRGLASFIYTQGSHEVEPPAGWEDYFGARPFYRFLDTRHGDTFESLRRLRHLPSSMNAEEAMRMFQDVAHGEHWHEDVWQRALNDVFRTMDQNPDVDAILGYSEGAMVGASLILEEVALEAWTGRTPRIKFAIFISGAPPLKLEGPDRIVPQLADQAGIVINIPTFHIFGCNDAFLKSAVALHNVCQPQTATMFDHGLGHIVPRDTENVQMIADILGDLIPRFEAMSDWDEEYNFEDEENWNYFGDEENNFEDDENYFGDDENSFEDEEDINTEDEDSGDEETDVEGEVDAHVEGERRRWPVVVDTEGW